MVGTPQHIFRKLYDMPTLDLVDLSCCGSSSFTPQIRPKVALSERHNSSQRRTMSAQDLWDSAKSLIAVTEKHPFLVAMVDGTLNMDSFQYYVVQDALYLTDFADGLRRISQNPSLTKEEAERFEYYAQRAEKAEKSLHGGFFKDWNISAEGVEQMPNTLLYTSYIKRVVVTRSHAEALACLLPCFWVYMHVGKCMLQLREELGESVKRPPQFDAWIDMYGGDDFEKNVLEYISIVDAACKTADEECLEEMKKHFIMCCKLEHMFWDQAAEKMKWPEIAA